MLHFQAKSAGNIKDQGLPGFETKIVFHPTSPRKKNQEENKACLLPVKHLEVKMQPSAQQPGLFEPQRVSDGPS